MAKMRVCVGFDDKPDECKVFDNEEDAVAAGVVAAVGMGQFAKTEVRLKLTELDDDGEDRTKVHRSEKLKLPVI